MLLAICLCCNYRQFIYHHLSNLNRHIGKSNWKSPTELHAVLMPTTHIQIYVIKLLQF